MKKYEYKNIKRILINPITKEITLSFVYKKSKETISDDQFILKFNNIETAIIEMKERIKVHIRTIKEIIIDKINNNYQIVYSNGKILNIDDLNPINGYYLIIFKDIDNELMSFLGINPDIIALNFGVNDNEL